MKEKNIRVDGDASPDPAEEPPVDRTGPCLTPQTGRHLAASGFQTFDARLDAFRVRLSNSFWSMENPREIAETAMRLLGEGLKVRRVFFAEVVCGGWVVAGGYDEESDPATLNRCKAAVSTGWIMEEYRAGRTIVVSDARTDRRLSPEERAAHSAADAVGAVGAPLMKDGSLWSVLVVHASQPREWSEAEIELIEEVAERLASALKRAKAEEELEESRRQLAAELAGAKTLQEISARLLPESDPDALLAQVLTAAAELMGSDGATIQLLDSDGNSLILLDWKGLHPDSAAQWARVAADRGTSCGQALARNERVIVDDVRETAGLMSQEDIEAFLRSGFFSVQSTPLVSRSGETLGMLSTHWRRARGAADKDFRLFDVLARQVTDLIERTMSEKALRESEARFRRLFSNNMVPMGIWTKDGNLIGANDALLALTGYSRSELEAGTLHWNAITPEEYRERDLKAISELEAQGVCTPYEKHYRRKDGSLVPILVGAGGFDERAGTGVLFAVDLTERKRAEEALRESEKRLRLALEAARMGIWSWEVATDVHTRDANLNLLLGLEPLETHQPFGDFLHQRIHSDDREYVAAAFDISAKRGRPLNIEFRIIRPDGAVRWLRDQGDVFNGNGSQMLYMAGACVDITDLKEAEAALRASEARFRALTELAPALLWETSPSGREVTLNGRWREYTGQTLEETQEGRWLTAIHPDDRSNTGRVFAEAFAAGHPLQVEHRIRRHDGMYRWFLVRQLPVHDDQGRIAAWFGTATDIHEEREARQRLEEKVVERTAELERTNGALRETLLARQELLRRLSTAQEDERRRVSRELHDGVGQELTALTLALKALEPSLPPGGSGRERLHEIEQIIGRIGAEAHDLAVELRPTALDDIGLASALSVYITRWSARTGVVADFQSVGLDPERLPPEVETAVYRVIQEALNNVAKHADARQVTVLVVRQDGELMALVEDDGHGFNQDSVESSTEARNLGLLGMRERVSLVGGELMIESTEGEGTFVHVRIPLDERAGSGNPGS